MITPTQEEQIDRTLHALGHVAPAPGMKARLLAGLDAHQSAAPLAARNPWRSALRPVAVALMLLLLAGAVLQGRRHAHRNLSATALQNPNRPTAVDNSLHGDATRGDSLSHKPHTEQQGALSFSAASAASAVSPSAQVGLPPYSVALAETEPAGQASPPTRSLNAKPQTVAERPLSAAAPFHLEATLSAQPVTSEDAQAMADFQAPSQLAPRLPPTAQENLVLLMLRRGEKHDLAQLDRAQQAVFDQAEQAARHNFFDPPSPIPPQPDYITPGTPK